ncbi:hypothetical protein CYMTET_51025 [Cymbomonas tetramitiformis]|uniref:Uncharacterized protein n=1 Tax=Cymbomonas tetramitiformis TaxID=36881 RepID=A0AAE0ESU6_9CHLO|nr:hypothetical protein CYMTET_51025 [Cymbomonas tetramitiformis]
MFCLKSFNGTPDRICCHVGGVTKCGIKVCPGVTKVADETDEDFKTRREEFKNARTLCKDFKRKQLESSEAERARAVLRANTAPGAVPSARRKRGRQTSIADSLTQPKLIAAQEAVAQAVFETDSSFNILEHDAWKEAFARVAECGPCFVSPTCRQVGGDLLDKAHKKVQDDINTQRQPVQKFGLTLVSDGATYMSKRPILNLLAVGANLVEFIKAQNCEGKVKDKEFIAQFIIDDTG